MLEVYRFLAENTERIAKLEHTPFYDGDDCTCWRITDGLQLWDANPKEMEKIPALLLTSSLIRSPDERLQALAGELNERYGGSWMIPVFMKAIITQPKEQVYETYSPLLGTPKASYLLNALGLLDYRSYPDDWIFERSGLMDCARSFSGEITVTEPMIQGLCLNAVWIWTSGGSLIWQRPQRTASPL